MSKSNYSSVAAVLYVGDYSEAVDWYGKWLGRAPDVTPDEGVAEWQLAENAWIQVSVAPDPGLVGKSTVICGVHNLEAQCASCQSAGVTLSEIEDYGFIKLANATDPAGNTVVFIQEIEQA
ncbi:MAG: hypothetical protein Q4G28_10880 [Neisseria sp.]|nr:hypothetical protein [Neisseria sp.]